MAEIVDSRFARCSINSQAYVDAGVENIFQDFPPAPTKTEETFEDRVVVTIDSERYEILPVSHKRMKIVRHYEEEPHRADGVWPIDAVKTHTATRVESLRTGEGDKELVKQAKDLLQYDRVTKDAELWDVLERLRAPRQEVQVTLPAGYHLDRQGERMLQRMTLALAQGDTKQALHHFSRVGEAKVDPEKVVDEHPGLTSRFREWLASFRD